MPLIIVMPEAKNSWYVNSETDPNSRYEDYIVHDLPDYVNSHYLIDTKREAIAGLSMGGYGALVLALRHPGKFQFVGDLSGAISVPGEIDSMLVHEFSPGPHPPLNIVMKSIIAAFGKNDNAFRDNHSVLSLLQQDKGRPLPYIFFMATGIQDEFKWFIPIHHLFIDSLRADGAAYEYHELPGYHNWKFWDMEIQPMLARMEAIMKLQKP